MTMSGTPVPDDREDKLQKFLSLRIAHPALDRVVQKLAVVLERCPKDSVVLVFGPTGVGKTTVALNVMERRIRSAITELSIDRGKIPIIYFVAPAAETGPFNWGGFYECAMEAGDEVLIQFKKRLPPPPESHSEESHLKSSRISARRPVMDKRWGYEQMLRGRKVEQVFIDNAMYIAKVGTGHRLSDQLDVLNSLAQRTETMHVLFGTYALTDFRNLSGQISRKVIEIHFPRYHLGAKQEEEDFASVISKFQNNLPLRLEKDLLTEFEFVYARSLGCVGVLKEWLDRVCNAAQCSGVKTISMELLESQSLSLQGRSQMLEEILAGEKALEDTEERRELFFQRLGISSKPATPPKTEAQKQKRNRRPGRRLPKRGRIGPKS